MEFKDFGSAIRERIAQAKFIPEDQMVKFTMLQADLETHRELEPTGEVLDAEGHGQCGSSRPLCWWKR